MDSVVEDENKHDQRLEETMKIFENGGDQCLQKTIKIKKRPPRCHDDEKKHDQRLEETMKIFEDGGDQCLQKMIKIKKRPSLCHDDDDDEWGCVQEKKKRRMKKMMDKAWCPSPYATPELPIILRNRIRALGGF